MLVRAAQHQQGLMGHCRVCVGSAGRRLGLTVVLDQASDVFCLRYSVCCQGAQGLPHEGSFTSNSTDVVDGTAQLLQQGLGAAGQHDEQRWVPYRHTNGVAIYHHKESAATCSLWSCGQVIQVVLTRLARVDGFCPSVASTIGPQAMLTAVWVVRWMW